MLSEDLILMLMEVLLRPYTIFEEVQLNNQKYILLNKLNYLLGNFSIGSVVIQRRKSG